MKIDASYLSPHVNTAARLEAATKQFDTMFLLSHDFVKQLSPRNQRLCRKIDCVVLVGKATATPLYCWDMWLGKPKEQGVAGCHGLSPLSLLNLPSSPVNQHSPQSQASFDREQSDRQASECSFDAKGENLFEDKLGAGQAAVAGSPSKPMTGAGYMGLFGTAVTAYEVRHE
jgi:hypothetical protein